MRGVGGGAGLAHDSCPPTPNTLEESSASQGGGDRNELQARLGSRPAGLILRGRSGTRRFPSPASAAPWRGGPV